MLLICMAAIRSYCGVWPQKGAKLNFNQIMFEYDKVKGADLYIVQVAEDKGQSSFNEILRGQNDSATATLITGLGFGKKYVWRYAGIVHGINAAWQGPFSFEISTDSLLSKNLVDLVVTKNDSSQSAGGLIMNDCTHSVTDRNGNLVWYLPKVNWHVILEKKNLQVKPQIFDLRITSAGTITYMADSYPIEITTGGDTLWTAPDDGKVSGGNTESYNHDFKRTPWHTYMVLGNQMWRELPPYKDTLFIQKKYTARQVLNGKENGAVEFGTVMEYNNKGKLIWSWNSRDYFDKNPLSQLADSAKVNFELKPHINAFSVNKKNEYVFVGFRNVSRIVKVEKRTGKVVNSWGAKFPSGEAKQVLNLYQQHDANVLDDNTIAVFNNNDYLGTDSLPAAVVFFQQPQNGSYIKWQYTCNFDSIDKYANRNGGNVDLLKNGNYLICTGNMNKIIEVTPHKQIVWQAELKANSRIGQQFFHRLYRAHYISSLYPCYFTFQTSYDTLPPKNAGFNLHLFNKGSEADSYKVEIKSTTGAYAAHYILNNIAAGQSTMLAVSPGKQLASGEKVIVTVSSLTNPDFIRQETLVAAK